MWDKLSAAIVAIFTMGSAYFAFESSRASSLAEVRKADAETARIAADRAREQAQESARTSAVQAAEAGQQARRAEQARNAIALDRPVAIYQVDNADSQLIPAVTGEDRIINFGRRILDTHDQVSTGSNWTFRAKTSGVYLLNVMTIFGEENRPTPVGNYVLALYVNNKLHQYVSAERRTNPEWAQFLGGTAFIFLHRNETADFRIQLRVDRVARLYAQQHNIVSFGLISRCENESDCNLGGNAAR